MPKWPANPIESFSLSIYSTSRANASYEIQWQLVQMTQEPGEVLSEGEASISRAVTATDALKILAAIQRIMRTK